MGEEIMSKLEDVQAEHEATMIKVASLDKDGAEVEEERRKALTREKALLQRVNEAEKGLERYRENLQNVGRQVDEINMSAIKTQLENLTQQVLSEGAEMKRLEDSVHMLEAANEELLKANERLVAEMARMAETRNSAPAAQPISKPVSTSASAESETPDADELDSENEMPRKKKKKSHKWAGGGADRDIIRQNPPKAQLSKADSKSTSKAATKPVAKPARKSDTHAVSKSTPKSTAKPARKSETHAVSKSTAKSAAKPARKSDSHTVLTKESKQPSKPAPSKAAKKTESQIPKPFKNDIDKPIIRSGKGWYEIAVTPVQSEIESQESGQSASKRPRGRPRKHPLPEQETPVELGAEGHRVTRNTRQQVEPSSKDAVPQKRKRNAETPRSHAQVSKPSRSTKKAKTTRNGQEDEPNDIHNEAGEVDQTDVFASPVSSPGQATPGNRQAAENDPMRTLLEQAAQHQSKPAVPGRRVIQQADDNLLDVFSRGLPYS
ncbi:hypothetical protein KC332_g15742 [Hortaea werneckii]|nr:hypothetical protein KC358_g16306 [Hortaea werneckii]KAI6802076.1 hypothetical protein KC350_g15523 [Hortaea werneckii]KAI6901892.1 hypothetical protein KC348_g16300 [Hortaea werneckii]KAI6922016.1 hypothetical protein KC341_g15619 [Hortaea werneckii]KAI6955401.1 hypothetical protein KC321_g15774 [Hortaea werneckii]